MLLGNQGPIAQAMVEQEHAAASIAAIASAFDPRPAPLPHQRTHAEENNDGISNDEEGGEEEGEEKEEKKDDEDNDDEDNDDEEEEYAVESIVMSRPSPSGSPGDVEYVETDFRHKSELTPLLASPPFHSFVHSFAVL